MIRTIQIEGFKSVPKETIELGRVNCFIGANGVGKSNVLEALGVLGAAANGRVDDEALLRRGVRPGLPSLYKTSFESLRMPAHIWVSASDGNGTDYGVSLLNPLRAPEPAWSFKTERLSTPEHDIVSDGVRNKRNLTPTQGLAALRAVDIAPDDPAAHLMRRLQNYAIYSPNTPTLRGMVGDQQSRSPLGLAGGSLAEAFAEFHRSVLSRNDELLDSVYGLIDWIQDIDTTVSAGALLSPSVARGKLLLRFTDRFMRSSRNTLTAYDASEGALYILFCAILCLSPQAPMVFAIDNIDQALNPRLVTRLTERLAGWLRSANPERQLLFTTHNPAVLDGLDLLGNPESRLFAVERNSEGHTRVRRVTITEDIRALNETYPLSRLWLMGKLGAVPNV
ncbi:ATP-binding protein [Magnetospirillum sp. 15-1]|uniref:AAA family ATPase n=1 Tax=Magnetospirillum sp. 15-1 TaxID=1979370 RepID=UPI000BBB6D74|nr:ATP-binding protein [Magnetospirillum sp. 15-1]